MALLLLLLVASASGLSSQQPQRRRQSGGMSRRPPGGGGRGGGPPPRKEGDWTCEECNAHNFKSRTECFKCGAPIKRNQRRDLGTRSRRPRGPAPWNGRNVDPRQIVDSVLSSGLWWLEQKSPNDLDEEEMMRVANIFGLENEDDVEAAVRKKFELFSLDDDNFVKPGHNPRVKEPALCEPQVYETNNTE